MFKCLYSNDGLAVENAQIYLKTVLTLIHLFFAFVLHVKDFDISLEEILASVDWAFFGFVIVRLPD